MLYAIIVGGIAGWLTGQLMRGAGYGILANILLGIAGGIIGRFVFGILGFSSTGNIIGELITAVVGASLLVFIVKKIRG